jgi:uncharacterized membrane protein YebE (DUF533 family)
MTGTGQETTSGRGAVDMVAVVRGMGRGFLVLVGGGLVAPALAMSSSHMLGSVLLASSAALAFVVAAVKQGRTVNGVLHGMIAAIGAYLLMLPLVVLAPAGRDANQISMTLAAAAAVGALAGGADQRWRTRKAGDRRS